MKKYRLCSHKQCFSTKLLLFGRKCCILPFRHCIVVDILCDFGDHDVTQLILYVGQKTAGIEGLIGRISFVKRLLGINIVREMYRDADGQFALRSIAVGSDSALADIVSDDLAFQFKVSAFAEHLQTRLALVDIAYTFRQVRTEGRIDHRGIVREISNGDGMRRLVVDVRSVEFVADAA